MKGKLERFRIVAGRDNVLEAGKELYFAIRGKWNKIYFKNLNPITIELACGRGEYTVGMGSIFPDRNFVGVDMKGDRIWKGSGWAIERNLANVGFLRAQILTLENFFSPGEADEIWLTFPDPRPKKRDVKRRLTDTRFLDIYKRVLRPGGLFRLKTDNTALFDFTLEKLRERTDIEQLHYTYNVYDSIYSNEVLNIKTRYEEMFASQGEKIKYLSFSFSGYQPHLNTMVIDT